MFRRLNRVWFRRLSYVGLFGITILTIKKIRSEYTDRIEDDDEFSQYTCMERKKHYISGMHHPFLTNNIEELNLFRKHFPEFEFLIGKDLNEIKAKHSLKSPVKFKSLSEYQNDKIDLTTDTLIVGGPPALITAVQMVQNNRNVIYLNDSSRIPIANGSAWHLEQDAQTEAPTNYKPTRFFLDQIKRLLFSNVSYENISKTGEFPWRTIDWIGWISHPEHWLRGIKIFFKYEFFTIFNDRTKILNDVSKQCFINQQFFEELNEKLNEKILLEENGSIIIARNREEINELNLLKTNLIKEEKDLNILSKKEILNRLNFIPSGLVFAEKPHDRVLLPNFMKILNEFVLERGGTVIDGRLQTIYHDEKQNEGIALFINQNQEKKFIKYSRLILSLGNQEIFDQNNKRLFDVVAARGVSVLANVYLPKGYQLPPVLVCGGTNHATKLNSKPIHFNQQKDLYLMRFTAGACVTPNVSNESTTFYDGTIAFGLIKSIQKCLGYQTTIHPLFIYGCNRQVSQYGQIFWFQPLKNVFIQYGAAGGGLTRAPDFITNFKY